MCQPHEEARKAEEKRKAEEDARRDEEVRRNLFLFFALCTRRTELLVEYVSSSPHILNAYKASVPCMCAWMCE